MLILELLHSVSWSLKIIITYQVYDINNTLHTMYLPYPATNWIEPTTTANRRKIQYYKTCHRAKKKTLIKTK